MAINFSKLIYYFGYLFHIFMGKTNENCVSLHCSFGTKKMINVKVRQISIWALTYTYLSQNWQIILIIQNISERMQAT
jgi:hypothetical protein